MNITQAMSQESVRKALTSPTVALEILDWVYEGGHTRWELRKHVDNEAVVSYIISKLALEDGKWKMKERIGPYDTYAEGEEVLRAIQLDMDNPFPEV